MILFKFQNCFYALTVFTLANFKIFKFINLVLIGLQKLVFLDDENKQ